MRILVTGLNGSVAPKVATVLESKGLTIVPYNREFISTKSLEAIETFIKTVCVDACIHFATGSVEWTKLLADITKKYGVKLLYISTVMVFDPKTQKAPFKISDPLLGKGDYASYKIESEKVLNTYNHVSIVRLGWQIDYLTTTNNMLNFLKAQIEKSGTYKASKNWYPACSFMKDTALGLYEILFLEPGIYHLDSNDGVSMYEIVQFLSQIHPWIKVNDQGSFKQDNRLQTTVNIKTISTYIKES
ncbi:MAG: sugar nucleotide-binding protein [Candidatus Izemoplasmataceae bacterium]